MKQGKLLLALFAVSSILNAADPPTYSTHHLKGLRPGIFVTPTFGAHVAMLTQDADLNLLGGFSGGVTGAYYFTPTVGVFVSETMHISKSPLLQQVWNIVSAGMTFQYHPFNGDLLAEIGLGGFVVFPISDSSRTGILVPVTPLAGFEIRTSTYYPLLEGFDLGVEAHVQFSASNLAPGSKTFVGLRGGLSGRVHF